MWSFDFDAVVHACAGFGLQIARNTILPDLSADPERTYKEELSTLPKRKKITTL